MVPKSFNPAVFTTLQFWLSRVNQTAEFELGLSMAPQSFDSAVPTAPQSFDSKCQRIIEHRLNCASDSTKFWPSSVSCTSELWLGSANNLTKFLLDSINSTAEFWLYSSLAPQSFASARWCQQHHVFFLLRSAKNTAEIWPHHRVFAWQCQRHHRVLTW